MSRLHNANSTLALGAPFMAALSDIGLQADRSAVSRWESGKMQPRYSVLTSYERVLDLPQGQLSSVVNALRRAYLSEGQRAWTPVLNPHSDAFHLRLDYLLDVLRTDRPNGGDWTEFGYYVCAPDLIYLHGSMWRDLTYRLVDELARSVGIAYLQRFETIRILLEHRIACSWLLRAAGDYLSDAAVQIVAEPVGVLEVSSSPQSGNVLLDKLVQAEAPAIFDASIPGIAYKVGMGQYARPELERIEVTLLRAMRKRPSGVRGLEELVVVMPEASQTRLLEAARGLPGHQELATLAAYGEWVRPDVAKQVSQTVAQSARDQMPSGSLYDEDPMTPRLVREAVFSARGWHRHLSSLLLLGSPFRGPLARVLVDEIDRGRHDPRVTDRLMHLLGYLVGPEQEEGLLAWIPQAEPEMLRDIAMALGRLPAGDGDLTPLVDRLGTTESLDRAILYALGMRADDILPTLAKDDTQPTAIREAAAWWLRQGGAVVQ